MSNLNSRHHNPCKASNWRFAAGEVFHIAAACIAAARIGASGAQWRAYLLQADGKWRACALQMPDLINSMTKPCSGGAFCDPASNPSQIRQAMPAQKGRR